MTAAERPWRTAANGLRLLVRVTPKASREGVDGVSATAQGPALAVRVRAPADKGEANRAVEAVVADWLAVPKSSVSVAQGGKSRLKTVAVEGEPLRLAARIEALAGRAG